MAQPMKALKITVLLFLSVLTLVVLLGISVFIRPTLLLNDRVLSSPFVQSLLPAELSLTWRELDIQVENLSLLRRDILINASHLCFQSQSLKIRTCFQEVHLGGIIQYSQRRVEIDKMGPLILRDGEFQMVIADSSPEPDSASEESSNPFILDPVYRIIDQVYSLKNQVLRLDAFRGPIEISVPQVELLLPSLSIRGSVQSPFYKSVEELSTQWLILKLAAEFEGLPLDRAEAEWKINPFQEGDTWSTISAYGRLHEAPEGEVHLVFQKTAHGHRIEIPTRLNLTRENPPLQIDSWQVLEISPESALLQIDGTLQNVPGPAPVIEPISCQMNASALLSQSDQTAVTGRCSAKTLMTSTPEWLSRVPESCRQHLPNRIGVLAEFSLPASEWFGEPHPRRTSYISATLDPVDGPILGLRGGATIEGALQEVVDLDLRHLEPRLELSAQIKSFQKAQECLAGFGLIVPAPFHLLDGTAQVEVGGTLERTNEFLQVPLRAAVNLREANQSVQVVSSGQFAWPFEKEVRPVLNADIRVREFFAVLPPFDPIRGIPAITPDPRFTTNQAPPAQSPATPDASTTSKEASASGLAYNLNIQTTQPAAVRLFYPLVDPYIPAQVHFRISSDGPFYGTLTIEDFDFEYLRRRTTIEKIALNFPQKEEEVSTVDGRLSVRQTNYTVYIDIVGPIDQPNIVLSSDPYLPRNDIISVLLFDRTSDEIAGGDRENVGSLESAIADRAIGLFGIWAFASTPIQSISYDPNQRTYAANVRLSDNTSVNIGTDWDRVRSVELRRRIARNWVVLTEVDPANNEDPGSSRLMLQWETRY